MMVVIAFAVVVAASEAVTAALTVEATVIRLVANPYPFGGGCRPMTAALFLVHCGPQGPAAGARRPHGAEGREGERSEAFVFEAIY